MSNYNISIMLYWPGMNWSDTIILGLVQGVTEFLPVSSSGHLVLFESWLAVDGVTGLTYDAILHFATVLAVITYFHRDIWVLIQVALRKLGRLPVNQHDITMLYALILGTIPGAFIGFFAESFVSEYTRAPWLVGVFLFLAALFFMYAEWRYYMCHGREKQLSPKTGLLVGFYQVLSLLPGVSRSGTTIAGGMLLGLSRYESSRFSFLLSIPIILGLGVKKTIDLFGAEGNVDWTMILGGALVAYLTALLVIHFFLRYIRRYTLWPFAWYSIILSGLVTYVYLFT